MRGREGTPDAAAALRYASRAASNSLTSSKQTGELEPHLGRISIGSDSGQHHDCLTVRLPRCLDVSSSSVDLTLERLRVCGNNRRQHLHVVLNSSRSRLRPCPPRRRGSARVPAPVHCARHPRGWRCTTRTPRRARCRCCCASSIWGGSIRSCMIPRWVRRPSEVADVLALGEQRQVRARRAGSRRELNPARPRRRWRSSRPRPARWVTRGSRPWRWPCGRPGRLGRCRRARSRRRRG